MTMAIARRLPDLIQTLDLDLVQQSTLDRQAGNLTQQQPTLDLQDGYHDNTR